MATSDSPKIIFGAGGIGTTESSFTYTWDTPEKVSEFLDQLQALGIKHLDGAASYPPGNPWNSETLLGQAQAAEKGFLIDSKILVSAEVFKTSLSESNIDSSIAKTLQLLGVPKVNILYAHMPNPQTPIEETLAAFDKHHKAGEFDKLGLCNYNYEQVKEVLEVCGAKGYVKPSVLQCQYNALWRFDEEKLFPLLREHNIKFHAYSPLAGGFLTGKVSYAAAPTPAPSNVPTLGSRSRWEGASAMTNYVNAYNKEEIHSAIRTLNEKLQALPEANGMTLTEASLRWIKYHSALHEGDGIIIGATRLSQVESNMEAFAKGPLPASVTELFDQLWEVSKREVSLDAFWGTSSRQEPKTKLS